MQLSSVKNQLSVNIMGNSLIYIINLNKMILLISLLIISQNLMDLYTFTSDSPQNEWSIVDDRVMGGISQGKFEITPEGRGRFFGYVTTENNGGFSSVRHRNTYNIESESHDMFQIRLKGDGKDYQFRVKTSIYEYHSYVHEFSTNGEWQTVNVPFSAFYPSFRGRKLNIAGYEGQNIEEITFLIANKKKENFELLIDKISVLKAEQ